jgi:hypothetical protein
MRRVSGIAVGGGRAGRQGKEQETDLMRKLGTAASLVSWVAQLTAAAIMLQTLFFKFSGAEESVAIFTQLGVEPWGRYATGAFELLASLLLLVPRTAALGGALGAGLMGGAVMSHLTVLGISVQDDGGALFGMAILVLGSSAIVAWLRRSDLPVIGPKLAPSD